MSAPLTLEHRLTTVENSVNAHDKKLDMIDKEIKDIVKLLSARPTWFITILLTGLTTVTSSLMVFVLTRH